MGRYDLEKVELGEGIITLGWEIVAELMAKIVETLEMAGNESKPNVVVVQGIQFSLEICKNTDASAVVRIERVEAISRGQYLVN